MRRIKPKSVENQGDLVNSQLGDIMLAVTPTRQVKYVVYEGEEDGRYLFREYETDYDFVYRSRLESLRFLIGRLPNSKGRIGIVLLDPYSLYYVKRREIE